MSELFLGDCFVEIPKLEDDSLDLVLTDFPYGISFMGKDWDNTEEGFFFKVGKALLPKMKAGSFLVTTFTPRMDMLWRCLSELEKAGFEMKTSPMFWLYHTGFPKASDMSKMIDKQKGLQRERFENKNSIAFKYDSKEMKQFSDEAISDEAISDEAKEWSGFKSFQLKPSVEMILCVQKPRVEKTIVGQVLANGCGAVNIGACKIPYSNGVPESGWSKSGAKGSKGYQNTNTFKIRDMDAKEIMGRVGGGRFPANLLCSGEPLKGEGRGNAWRPNLLDKKYEPTNHVYGKFANKTLNSYPDAGTVNRFYSLDAWWEKRGITLCGDTAFFDVPKPSKAEKNKGIGDGTGSNTYQKKCIKCGKWKIAQGIDKEKYTCRCEEPEWEKPKGNNHTTVKPIKLFTYLCELFSKKGDTVLDPFMGSGTTGIACSILQRKFIGIEKEKDYFEIAEARIKEQNKQTSIFKGNN